MPGRRRYIAWIAAGACALLVLLWLSLTRPADPTVLPPWVFFTALIVFTTTFGVPLAGGAVSLLPMTTVAAFLVMGLVPAAWAAFVGALLYGVVRHRWAEQLGLRQSGNYLGLAGLIAANTAMQSASVLAGGAIFLSLGGTVPLAGLDASHLLPLLALSLAYLATNYLVAGFDMAARGQETLWLYLRSLPNLLLYEGAPLVFAPLMALVYTRLGLGQFVLFALVLVAASLITRNLAFTSRRLERRVKELDSLQAVGQALSASLQIENVLSAIYDQVTGLMPARNFYVALYDPEVGEVSFPLAVENGERVRWRSRRMGKGLTEHILRTRKPLLIRRDVGAALRRIGLDEIGRLAASWLGVPILAGDEALGVIAVQSYTKPEVYDVSHQEVLVTISTQAAAAIQNARLYARTDEALARRVQELDSILRTTREGIMLLDLEWHVLAANRALSEFLGVAQMELVGQYLQAPRPEGEQPLVTLIGYTPAELQEDCEALSRGEPAHQERIVVPGPPERHVERTLTPVRDRAAEITGWLLVFRDLTKEIELARLRDDLTHMLVHDLRSPLTVLGGSLDLIEVSFDKRDRDDFNSMLAMARRGSARMLNLVNQLLDINGLESGQMPLNLEDVDVSAFLDEIADRFLPLAAETGIEIEVMAEQGLPTLYADPVLIGRVLNNLLDNAIKFTPDGGHIQLWARPDSADDPKVILIGVSDNGPGIPPEEHSRLFRKFERVLTAEGRRTGTGLGLPFCKLAVEAHGGRILVESEVGKGSTFIVRLPVVGADREAQGQ